MLDMLCIGPNSSMQMLVYQPLYSASKSHCAFLSLLYQKPVTHISHCSFYIWKDLFFFKQNLLKLLIIDYGKTDITKSTWNVFRETGYWERVDKKYFFGKYVKFLVRIRSQTLGPSWGNFLMWILLRKSLQFFPHLRWITTNRPTYVWNML